MALSNTTIDDKDIQKEFEGFNKEFEEKLLAANEDKTLVKWAHLLDEFMETEIFMAGNFAGENNGADITNVLVIQKDGKNIVPFFSHPEHIKKIPGDQIDRFDVIKIKAGHFFRSIKGSIAVLNPWTEISHVFTGFDTKVLAVEYEDKLSEEKKN